MRAISYDEAHAIRNEYRDLLALGTSGIMDIKHALARKYNYGFSTIHKLLIGYTHRSYFRAISHVDDIDLASTDFLLPGVPLE
jgi:hypothetical protein